MGFNIQRFDDEPPAGDNPFFDPAQIPTLDRLVELMKSLPHRLSDTTKFGKKGVAVTW